MTDAAPVDVLVMGAGAVGCFVGGSLAAAGVRVAFVGRPRILNGMARYGLRLSDLDGDERRVAPGMLHLVEEVPAGIRPALVLLTVKSGDTAEAAAALGEALPAGTPVLSLQNGVSNTAIASRAAPSLHVLPGVVPYNVTEIGVGAFHRGIDGRLAARDDPGLRRWVPVFKRAAVPMNLHADLAPVQWAKLLLNLNNPVNALSGLPLREQLLQHGYRLCLAALMDEALDALAAAGITPAPLNAVPAYRLPAILRLPTLLFRLAAARMLRIDAHAHSSMADDLALGRRTEVDAFCGEVARLAQAHGAEAPRNAKMVELLEAWPSRPEPLSARQLRAALGL